MIVMPADHYIFDVNRFHQILKTAVTVAREKGALVTIGIQPVRPESGYGYIERGCLLGEWNGIPVYEVRAFTEKPSPERALAFLSAGNYYWNSGMFIWRVDVIRAAINKHLPELAEGLERVGAALQRVDEGRDYYEKILQEIYPHLPRISVDYGIMEKSSNVLMLPGDFGWDDVGSWPALERCYRTCDNGNVIAARGVFLETRDSIIHSSKKVVATLGISGLVIVDEDDCLLVCAKERSQEIRKIVEELRRQGFKDVL